MINIIELEENIRLRHLVCIVMGRVGCTARKGSCDTSFYLHYDMKAWKLDSLTTYMVSTDEYTMLKA